MSEKKRRRSCQTYRPCEPPGAHHLPWRRLYQVPSHGVNYVVVLSNCLTFFPVHYDVEQRRFFPCLGHAEECYGHQNGWPELIYGYCAVMTWPDRKLRLLAVPPAAYTNCPNAHLLLSNARGRILCLSRIIPSARGPIKMEVRGMVKPDEKLPACWEVTADVYRRFGLGFSDQGEAQEPERARSRRRTEGRV